MISFVKRTQVCFLFVVCYNFKNTKMLDCIELNAGKWRCSTTIETYET